MTEVVEGPWKDLTFRMLTSKDQSLVFDYLKRDFFADEPISSIVGVSEAKERDFQKNISYILSHDLSFAAFDPTSGEMAGINLISLKQKNGDNWTFVLESREMNITADFLRKMDADFNIFKLYNVEEYSEIRIVAVGREFRRRGLATELFKRGLRLLKNLNHVVVKCVVSSPHTQVIASHLGFEELGRSYYRDMKDLNGQLLCPQSTQFSSYVTMLLHNFKE